MGKPNIRISECLECTSSTLQESDVSEVGTYPVYGANGIVGYLNGYNTSDEAIYIIKDGSGVGSVSYVKGKCSATGTLNILTAKQDSRDEVSQRLGEHYGDNLYDESQNLLDGGYEILPPDSPKIKEIEDYNRKLRPALYAELDKKRNKRN